MSAIIPSDSGQANSSAPVPEFFLALAPRHLPNHRKERYQGDDLCVPLESMAARDQELMRGLYQDLSALLYAIADASTDDTQKWQQVWLWLQHHDLDAFISDVRELGGASRAQGSDEEELAKTMHDVRGGPLSALLGRLQLLDHQPRDENQLKTIFVLVRDHLKIMRNSVTGLDDGRRDADRRPKSHDMKLMLDKWQESIVGPKWKEQPIRISVDCRYEGTLTECCLESAAMDRIFYNLANNACRHAAGDRIDMVIFPIPQPPGECLRFVLSNEVSETDAAALRSLGQVAGDDSTDQRAGLNLRALFTPEVSSTGSGFGLTVVADFVAGAFGLRGRQEALRGRYVGAILDGSTVHVWFHWPIASDGLPDVENDDFRHPEQSLSEA